MPTRSIGFLIENDQQFMELLGQVLQNGDKQLVSFGTKHSLLLSNGEELIALSDDEKEVFHFSFHYRGKSQNHVGIFEVDTHEDGVLTGLTFASLNAEDPNLPESGSFPFVFQTGDLDVLEGFRHPEKRVIELSAFANSIQCFDSEDEFYSQDRGDSGVNISPQAFIPAGLFQEEQGELAPTAFFTGLIKEANFQQNEMTKQFYWHLIVETYDMEIDVLVAPERVTQGKPTIGGIVQVEAWLTGRFV